MVDSIVRKKKYAVVVVTYGEVETLTIGNLWPSSRRIVKVVTSQIVKLPDALVYFLADYRSTKHFIDWKLNRYRSSLLAINRAQKDAVAGFIAKSTHPILSRITVDIFDAYYFFPPYFEEMMLKLQDAYDGVVVASMIPVESAFSCGLACRMIAEVYGDARFTKVRMLKKLWQDEQLQRIYVDYLFSRIAPEILAAKSGKIGLVLVIHGTLVRDRKGNPPKVFTGLDETIKFFEMMRSRIMADSRNCFQEIRQGCMNHSAGGEWTADTAQKALRLFRDEGYEAVVMFPYGFFADNSETEYEARKLLDQSGFPLSQYVGCVNGSSDFTRWLANRVVNELQVLYDLQNTYETLEENEKTVE
jgi:protoporphyrin/coproporphyrin ferrochelatase